MFGRQTIFFPLAMLGLLALLTLWIDRTVQEPERKPDGNSRHDPDYIVNNFVTSTTDVNGDLRHVLAAVEMRHYPDDDSTQLERPRFTQYTTGKPYTQIEGQKGLVSSNGENVQFTDNVKVVRQAYKGRGEMTVVTEYLNVTPKQELAVTDKPVMITQAPKTVVYATGMVFDKKKQTIELLSRVKAHYERPGQPKNPGSAGKPQNTKQAQPPAAQQSKASANSNAKRQAKPNQSTRIRRKYEPPATP